MTTPTTISGGRGGCAMRRPALQRMHGGMQWLLAVLVVVAVVAPDAVAAERTGARGSLSTQWMDVTHAKKSMLREWTEEQTFCLVPNASMRIEMDELNSTMQPPLLRKLSEVPEMDAMYKMTRVAFKQVQEYAWPFRSLFWAWSNLRVIVHSPHHEQFTFAYSREPGAICRSLLAASKAAPSLSQWLPPAAVDVFAGALHGLASLICENCVHGCGTKCEPVAAEACMMVLSPFNSPCITVTAPSPSIISSTMPSLPFSIALHTVFSSTYMQNFVMGVLLFYFSQPLSRSRTFHYLLAAAIGISFSALLALYFFSRQTRSAMRMIPGAQLVQSVGALLSFVVPFTGFVVVPAIYHVIEWGISYLNYVWSAESLLGIPHLGKVYFVFFGFFGCFLVWWNQWGATPKNEQDEQTREEIDEIGYLEEDTPLTPFQSSLARLIRAVAMILIFYGTSSTESSMLALLLVSSTRVLQFFATIAYYWYYFEEPGRHSVLISKQQYEQQAVNETEKALKELQAYLARNPSALDKVKEENEIRLRRFAKGRNHLDVATQDSKSQNQRNARSKWGVVFWPQSCSVQ